MDQAFKILHVFIRDLYVLCQHLCDFKSVLHYLDLAKLLPSSCVSVDRQIADFFACIDLCADIIKRHRFAVLADIQLDHVAVFVYDACLIERCQFLTRTLIIAVVQFCK